MHFLGTETVDFFDNRNGGVRHIIAGKGFYEDEK